MITPYVVTGISTGELDERCYDFIVNEQKSIPANVGYNGFENNLFKCQPSYMPWNSSDKKILKNGDILNIDVTVIKRWFGVEIHQNVFGRQDPAS